MMSPGDHKNHQTQLDRLLVDEVDQLSLQVELLLQRLANTSGPLQGSSASTSHASSLHGLDAWFAGAMESCRDPEMIIKRCINNSIPRDNRSISPASRRSSWASTTLLSFSVVESRSYVGQVISLSTIYTACLPGQTESWSTYSAWLADHVAG